MERPIRRPQSLLVERFESDGCEVRAQRLEEFERADLNVSGAFGAAFMQHLEQAQCGWCERKGYRRAVLDLASRLLRKFAFKAERAVRPLHADA